MIFETIEAINLHRVRAKNAYEEIKLFKDTLHVKTFQDFEKVKSIDTFIFRFIKIQDLIGDKFFKDFLKLVGNYKDSMTMLDILDTLEKLEFIESASQWIEYRNLRNTLTHEYPDNEEEVAEGILLALEAFIEVEMIFDKMTLYLNNKNIDLNKRDLQ
ncbi:MAG: hypothetical protein U9P71_00325 [Campylobacterota bacterium]|nr:hypothetical protein [Campylobacterota bacterium]